MKNLNKKHYYAIGAWFIINLLQAFFTGLHSDESYYWMYSENMAWGYFDHPPMAALLIHLGHTLMAGEAGVRLIMILLSTATFTILLNELNEKKDIYFLLVFVLSFPLVHTHIAGFMALPDIPLLFFVMLFLILYKQFIQKADAVKAILLGAVTAAMIYSKYHAFLIIGFTVLSNLKLLRNRYFWLSVLTALLLLLPHVWWQFENDFPTFKYHLIDRAKPFRLKYVFPNLYNQLLMAGPLTGVLIFWKLAKVKIVTPFQRALIFNILGFYILFFILSFKNRIEAHWSAAIIPMLMLLVYPYISKDSRFRIWFLRLSVPIIALMFIYRLYLALDVIPNIGNAKITFYKREAHALEIKEKANGQNVAFYNNYAAASNYIFYTGDSAVHLSTPGYRFCQYDLWNEEEFARGTDLFAVQPTYLNPPVVEKMITGQEKGFITIDDFQPLNGIMINLMNIKDSTGRYLFTLELINTTRYNFSTNHISEPEIAIMQDNIEVFHARLDEISSHKVIPSGSTAVARFSTNKEVIGKEGFILYTCTKNQVRGEILAITPDRFINANSQIH